jgi:short/branched chain acyl-CoA dehydrogenase
MGVQVDPEYGGSGCNFMTTVLCVEELSKVDPSVGILVDLQNTLINNVIIKLGNEEQKKQYLPRLATNTVSSYF